MNAQPGVPGAGVRNVPDALSMRPAPLRVAGTARSNPLTGRLALTPKHSINERASSLNRAGRKAFIVSPPAACDGPGSSPLPSASDDGSHP